MSESRGGRHGEAFTSHDEKKTYGEVELEATAESNDEANEGQGVWIAPKGESEDGEGRQSQPSIQDAVESVEEGGFGVTETTEQSAKSIARILSTISNDPRITNVMMLVIVAIGLGVHESIQTQVCSL